MIRNKSYIFSGDMQVITEILDGKTFHQCASRIDEFYRLKFGDTCITRKNIRFISYFTTFHGHAQILCFLGSGKPFFNVCRAFRLVWGF